jgi:hypothetical protein
VDAPGAAGEELGAGDLAASLEGLFDGGLIGLGGGFDGEPQRVHVAIDDVTQLAYVEVLADEQQATAIGFLSRTVAWFNGQGLQSPWPQAHPHQALHAPHQWKRAAPLINVVRHNT